MAVHWSQQQPCQSVLLGAIKCAISTAAAAAMKWAPAVLRRAAATAMVRLDWAALRRGIRDGV